MATSTDQSRAPSTPLEAVAALTAPGGPFELVEEEVLGSRMPVFRNRGRNLGEVVLASARYGEGEYLVTEVERLTFAEHATRVASLAQVLRTEYGIGKGDRVAIAAANSPAWVVTFWATVSLGAVVVGYNAWWSKPELEFAMSHSEPRLVVADSRRLEQLADVDIPVLDIDRDVVDLSCRHADAVLPPADVAEDDPAVILYTSGTSGRPKGAVHSHRNLMAVIEYHRYNDAAAAAFGDPADPRSRRYLLALPLFHIAGLHNLAVARLATGSTVVMHLGGFDPERVLRLIERERVTNWGAVPTMASRLMKVGDLSGYDLSSLTAFALASAPSSPAFHERLRRDLPFATNLANSYGMTESCTAASVATPIDLAEVPDTVGRPIPSVQIEVRDPDGQPLPDGEEGEICLRSQFNMLGYWRDDAATDATIRADRWLHTGDIGVMENGRIRLSSRRSDLIIRGGENVYPAEVEAVLAEHAGVRESVVLGVANADLGQEVAAVVVVDEPEELTEAQLHSFAAESLAHFKVPTRWRITSEALPRNPTGKVVRREVQV
jgi:acyl-CoA synthetase (AMP-forming)/AMP-acid ligase II